LIPTTASADAGITPSSSLPPQESSTSLPVGLVAGAAVGATLGFVALVVLGYLLFRRHSKKRGQQQQQRDGAGHSHHLPPTYAHSEYPHAPSEYRHAPSMSQQSYGYSENTQPKGVASHRYDPGPWHGVPVEVISRNQEPVELGTGR
jgi:hypothetical protein